MRVGDVRRIERMVREEHTAETIVARFVNEYPEDEILRFVSHGKSLVDGPVVVDVTDEEAPAEKASPGGKRAKNK